jgi:hypothetical protein
MYAECSKGKSSIKDGHKKKKRKDRMKGYI